MDSLEVELKPASQRDAARIAKMSRDQIELGLGWSWRKDRILGHMRSKHSIVLVARIGESIAGFAIMKFAENQAHLLLFAVVPAMQRQGIGRRMIEWLESCARTAGIEELRLEVKETNRAGRAFYKSLGFREHYRLMGYYQGRASAVLMTKDLCKDAWEELAEKTEERGDIPFGGLPYEADISALEDIVRANLQRLLQEQMQAFGAGLEVIEREIWLRRITARTPEHPLLLSRALRIDPPTLRSMELSLQQRWQETLQAAIAQKTPSIQENQ